ncbi:MAG: class I SAM-dependent methyltransferase [bacterium]
MDVKEGLRKFYDAQAEKYYQTRNKHRADADIFLDEIKHSKKKTIHILEFGCGSGRLLAHLQKIP